LSGPGSGVLDLVEKVAAKLDSWPTDVVLNLAACARFNLYPNPDLIRSLRKLTGLLPPQELSPLTEGDLRHAVPPCEKRIFWDSDRLSALATLRESSKPLLDDERLLAIWPARSKSDLSIRRTRFRDCYQAYKLAGTLPRLWSICDQLPGFDIISVVNFLNADFVLSTTTWSWFDFFSRMGAFDADVSHYGAVAKVINDKGKKYPLAGVPMLKVVECGVMTGYRNPPFPGFDVVDETRKLAEAGEEHGLLRRRDSPEFQKIADEILDTEGEPVEWISFRDYVTSAEWETTGSSTVGDVEWEFGEEKGHFKARKNLVPDVYDLEDLGWEAENETDQENKAITKSELGKVRIAVAGDIYTYLKMSWITRYLGGSYKKWPASTIEEDAAEQTDRMLRMLEAATRAWNLPFDYAGFDHQITTPELKVIVSVLLRVARRNVPVEHHIEFDVIGRNVLESFDRSSLTCRDPEGKSHKFKVTGGLESGLRWTTIVGNGWNEVMTEWVYRLLRGMGVTTDSIRRWIRGDDSAIVCPSFAETLLFRECYDALNAQGSDGKFGIHFGKSEFLRTWFDEKGCQGYPARTIPGLQQRKPWSAAPWDDESTMAHVYDSVRTLRRRGVDHDRVDMWWRGAKIVWSQRNHVSSDWLQIPRNFGGLGIEPWDGRARASKPWPRVDTLRLRVLNQTPWRSKFLQDKYASWLPITQAEAVALAQQKAAEKVATDDVPALNSVYRKMAQKPAWRTFKSAELAPWNVPGVEELKATSAQLASAPAEPGCWKRLADVFRVGSFGSYSWLAQKWADASEIWRLRGARNLLAWFHLHYPSFYLDVKKLERHGLARWEALDWLFGSTPLNTLYELHPTMTLPLHRAVCQVVSGFVARTKLKPGQLSLLVADTTRQLERSLSSSRLVKTVYAW